MSKKVINQVYLDMDGVLSDFDLETVDKLKSQNKWQNDEFPKFVDKKGFEHLPMIPDAKLLIDFLKNTGVKICILSSAGDAGDRYKEIVRQKKAWLKKQGIDFPAIIVENKDLKQDYAKKHALLIDDTKQNCKQFKNTGGRAIWHKNALHTIAKISKKYFLTGDKNA